MRIDRWNLLSRGCRQFMSLLLGARFFVLLFFTFALYVSTFFLFNQEEDLRAFVFDYKVHGIMFCSIFSIASGGFINQFYDLEKDKVQRPFRTNLQSFLKQKYFLYSYIILNILSLTIALVLSPRIFLFFLFYQFMMWLYSHRISKVMFLSNITFVGLSLYPFFGMLVYYAYFSWDLFFMAIYLFLILLVMDIVKDFLTIRADVLFGYKTLPIGLGIKKTAFVLLGFLLGNIIVSIVLMNRLPVYSFLWWYYSVSIVVFTITVFLTSFFSFSHMIWVSHLLRVWIFFGVLSMLFNGIWSSCF